MFFARDFITTVLALALSATRVEATVAIGTGAGYNLMWIDGGDPCRWSKINNIGENPCEVFVNPLSNGHTYKLHGCGGDSLWLTNGDGSFNSNCHDSSANLACNVHRNYRCS